MVSMNQGSTDIEIAACSMRSSSFSEVGIASAMLNVIWTLIACGGICILAPVSMILRSFQDPLAVGLSFLCRRRFIWMLELGGCIRPNHSQLHISLFCDERSLEHSRGARTPTYRTTCLWSPPAFPPGIARRHLAADRPQ
ncbi:hypothetical protein BO71DRAFT_6260 [Aspergillus ellipticus CBS 707.79]|uniref:Uncharacterized protein n=1 Tax=Aspergillus ellipticus CBS 707.79 TaxID=1448320 RepID=A0A319DY73_9EURO|nr:hypothetical protein BO71DRAFT_6260 [Aspergillus ellipticus CBS 707.79]